MQTTWEGGGGGQGGKEREICTNMYMHEHDHSYKPVYHICSLDLLIYFSLTLLCVSSFSVFFASCNKFSGTLNTPIKNSICACGKTVLHMDTGTVQVLMYSTVLIENLKIFSYSPWGNAKMHRSMRGWLLVEGNLHFPSSFLLPIPFPSLCASSLLQHRSSRSHNYLLYCIIYWQLHTVCSVLTALLQLQDCIRQKLFDWLGYL